MAVFPENGQLVVSRGGRRLWTTATPPVSLIPDAWREIPITIEFPDFPKDIAYGFNLLSSQVTTQGYGMSVVKMLPQELQLPDITLGTVPAGINYVDWRVRLDWTNRPSPSRAVEAISPVRRGADTDLRGGSGLLEIGGCYRRMIHVGLVGNSIVLQRKQSSNDTQENVNWAAGNQVWNPNDSPRIGWTYGTSIRGSFTSFIEIRASGNNAHRGGRNGASLIDNTNYFSRWAGVLLVKPGRQNPGV